jgi:hypothetical protein
MLATAIAVVLAVSLCSLGSGLSAGAQATQGRRIEVIAVVGCVTQEGSDWLLTKSSRPIEIPGLDANKVTATMAAEQPAGSQTYRLIGKTVLEEFHISSHAGHWGLVKGLPIRDDGKARLNVVSFAMLADSCK